MRVKVTIEAVVEMGSPDLYCGMTPEEAAREEVSCLFVGHESGIEVAWSVVSTKMEISPTEQKAWGEALGWSRDKAVSK